MSELRAQTMTRPVVRLFLFALPPSWAGEAGCAEADPEVFCAPHGERTDSAPREARIAAAKAVCAKCTVRAECLTYALDTRQHDGVWGGLTESERRTFTARRKAARP